MEFIGFNVDTVRLQTALIYDGVYLLAGDCYIKLNLLQNFLEIKKKCQLDRDLQTTWHRSDTTRQFIM